MALKRKHENDERGAGRGVDTGSIILVVVIAAILVGGFFFAVARFDFPPGVRGWFIDAVNTLDPASSQLETRRARLDHRESELDVREDELRLREAELIAFENELIVREERLRPIYEFPMSDQDLQQLQSVSAMYSRISPDAAAGILEQLYNPRASAAILFYMPVQNAAMILNAMSTETAAEVTQILLYNYEALS